MVRKLVGYQRYDKSAQVKVLNRLYERYRLYINFFLPVTRLLGKGRIGSRIEKTYDLPKTPYQGVLDAQEVGPRRKEALMATYRCLDVVTLRTQIDVLLANI